MHHSPTALHLSAVPSANTSTLTPCSLPRSNINTSTPITNGSSYHHDRDSFVGGSGGGNASNNNSLLAKLNTFSRSRRRRQEEADQLIAEAKQAMEDPLMPASPEISLEGFQLAEGEERSMIEMASKRSAPVQELITILLEWINLNLVDERILVRDIEADLYDGQVLQRLVERLMGVKINHPEVSQSEVGQRQRLKLVLDQVNVGLGLSQLTASQHWSPTKIYDQDLVAILRLLTALTTRYAPLVRLPRHVQLSVLIVRKINGMLQHRREIEYITGGQDSVDYDTDYDAISALVDCAVPDKLAHFQRSLLDFVNYHLGKLNLSVSNLESEMDDGVYFILLIGLLRNFFVPLSAYHVTPVTHSQRMSNLQLAFALAAEEPDSSASCDLYGGPRRHKAEDILQHDLKTILRFLNSLYIRFKDVV